MPKKAKTLLTDMNITHVSYVEKGANNKRFFLMKSDDTRIADNEAFERAVRTIIRKSDDEKRLVYGIVYEPDTVDEQGDYTTSEEIEKAAHRFLTDARNIDLQHNFQSDYGTVVESYIAPVDFQIEEETVKKGSWALVTKAAEEVWKDIKEGKITGYSMGGSATKTEVQKETINLSEKDELRGFFNTLKSFFQGETKSNVKKENGGTEMTREELESIIAKALAPVISRLDALEKTYGEHNREVTEDVIKEALEKTLETIDERMNKIEKSFEPQDSFEDVTDSVAETIKKALEPINDRLCRIEKTKGVSRQPEAGVSEMQKSTSIWDGLEI